VSFVVDPVVYPRTYASTAAPSFVKDDGRPLVCKTCSFRPWAQSGSVASASVTVQQPDGSVAKVPAVLDAASGRWVADAAPGSRARVERGDVVDEFGEINGSATDVVAVPGPGAGFAPVGAAPGSAPAGAGVEAEKAGSSLSMPFRHAGSWSGALSALLMLLVIAGLLAGVGVGRSTR
jgi:hypothetical protein